MSTGQEQVQVALDLCQNISGGVRTLTIADDGWKTEVAGRLDRVQQVLDGVKDRFFLRTKLCLPFAARCGREAQRLEEMLRSLDGDADGAAQQRFTGALTALEKAAKALEDRSTMQGMAIT